MRLPSSWVNEGYASTVLFAHVIAHCNAKIAKRSSVSFVHDQGDAAVLIRLLTNVLVRIY